eukprot:ANDGO_04087.mRNA.1 hypothetical protein
MSAPSLSIAVRSSCETPQAPSVASKEFISCTPNPQQARIFKFGCPICMQYFKRAHVTRCCSQKICDPCARSLWPELDTSFLGRLKTRKLPPRPCPYCNCDQIRVRKAKNADADFSFSNGHTTPRGQVVAQQLGSGIYSTSSEDEKDGSSAARSGAGAQYSESKHQNREQRSSTPFSPFKTGMSFEDLKRKMMRIKHEGYDEGGTQKDLGLAEEQRQLGAESRASSCSSSCSEWSDSELHVHPNAHVANNRNNSGSGIRRLVHSAPPYGKPRTALSVVVPERIADASNLFVHPKQGAHRPTTASAALPPRPSVSGVRRSSVVVPIAEDEKAAADVVPPNVAEDAAERRVESVAPESHPPLVVRNAAPNAPSAPESKKTGCCSIL